MRWWTTRVHPGLISSVGETSSLGRKVLSRHDIQSRILEDRHTETRSLEWETRSRRYFTPVFLDEVSLCPFYSILFIFLLWVVCHPGGLSQGKSEIA